MGILMAGKKLTVNLLKLISCPRSGGYVGAGIIHR
jgi:hypothetical protein